MIDYLAKAEALLGHYGKLQRPDRNGQGPRRSLGDENPVRPSYVEAAFRGEVRRVESAPRGSRNDTLNVAAFQLGRFVSSGLLAQSEERTK